MVHTKIVKMGGKYFILCSVCVFLFFFLGLKTPYAKQMVAPNFFSAFVRSDDDDKIMMMIVVTDGNNDSNASGSADDSRDRW